jgi:RTX calcium-binding nonapeptide repeat (4 copies)/Bacterial pre-peptidase C-terminal domain
MFRHSYAMELLECRRLLSQFTIISNETAVSALSSGNPTDTYTFAASTGDSFAVFIATTAGTLVPHLDLFDPNGVKLDSAGDEFDTNTIIGFQRAKITGNFKVVVSGTGTGGSYQLKLAEAPGTQASNSDSGLIGDGQVRSGTLGAADFDMFTFDATAGDQFRLGMSRTSGNSTSSLHVFAKDGVQVASAEDEFAANETIDFTTAPQTGTYYVVASNESGGSGAYTLGMNLIKTSDPLFAELSGGILSITGTSKADAITVEQIGSNLQAERNTENPLSFPIAGVSRIEIAGGAGNDVINFLSIAVPTYVNAGTGNDQVVGGSGNDTLTGGAGKDTLYGGFGDDRINGDGSADQLFGEAGNDRLYGGAGDDSLNGGAGVDRLFGGATGDVNETGTGEDTLVGNSGNDKLYGQDGNDLFVGGAGADLINGGVGYDIAVKDPLDTRTSIEFLM